MTKASDNALLLKITSTVLGVSICVIGYLINAQMTSLNESLKELNSKVEIFIEKTHEATKDVETLTVRVDGIEKRIERIDR